MWFQRKKSIQDLLTKRDKSFKKATNDIFAKIPQALETFQELILEQEPLKNGSVIQWTEISLISSGLEEPLLIIVGLVTFPIGSKVSLVTGESIVITADTAQYFPPRLIRIGLPLKIIESSKEEIKDFILKSDEVQSEENELQEIKNIEPLKTIASKKDSVTTSDDFDLTQLTEEQRQNLIVQKPGHQ